MMTPQIATTTPITSPGTITKSYPRIAFSSAITPATEEHYEYLRQAGINTVSVCLHVSDYNHYKFASIHTNLARKANMTTHAYMVTDLHMPVDDVTAFTNRFVRLGFCAKSKITVWINGDQYVDDREDKILKIIDLLSNYHDRENIDLAFFKRDIDDGLYDLAKLPKMLNLTIINVGALSSGIDEAGTWIYDSEFCENVQILAYDYYGYYAGDGYQLSLVDTDYVVQLGDTWHSISRRHGIPMTDLLALNRAVVDDKIFEGQVVRIAQFLLPGPRSLCGLTGSKWLNGRRRKPAVEPLRDTEPSGTDGAEQ